MSLFSDLNFLATVLAFGTVSFAASNFGTKLGRVSGFINRSGYQYVSKLSPEISDKLYETIAKDATPDAPYWAKNKDTLRTWCRKNERKARKWSPTSQYCLVKNTVKHQLLKEGKEILEGDAVAGANQCNVELWNSYDDGTKSSKGYLFAMTKCIKKIDPSATIITLIQPQQAEQTNSATSDTASS